MTWVLSLAGSGGTAGSHGGHEARRHRVRGPFPMAASLLVAATLALAGCGSSSSSIVSNEEGTGSGGESPNPPPPEPDSGDTVTQGDGGSDTDSGDTSTTGDGGQTVTQQPQQPEPGPEPVTQQPQQPEPGPEPVTQQPQQPEPGPEPVTQQPQQPEPGPEPVTQQLTQQPGNRQPPPVSPPNNPPVVSSLPRSGGRLEPRPIANCGRITPITSQECAYGQRREGVLSDTNISYTLENRWYLENPTVSLQGKDRNLEANVIEKNDAFNPLHQNYNFRYKNNIRGINSIEVTYRRKDGFYGLFSYRANSIRTSAELLGDVALKATFRNDRSGKLIFPYIKGYIGDNGYDDIIIGSVNFGRINFSATDISEDGQFTSNTVHFSNKEISMDMGFNELRGSFKNDGSITSFPTQVVGELEIKRFFDASPIKNNDSDGHRRNLFERGDNALAGVFVADKTAKQEIRFFPIERKEEGNIGMFSYGLWASDRLEDNRASLSIPKGQEILFPLPSTTILNAGTSLQQETLDNILVQYKKENGFRGAYVYKDQTGTFESDVHLVVSYSGFPNTGRDNINIGGFIAKPFTMEGDSFNGIIIKDQSININDGSVNALDKFSGGLAFGSENFDSASKSFNGFSKQSLEEQGNFSLTFGATDGQEGSASLEKYPNHVGGELKITGFSLDETENYLDNSLVGVFVGDKESASNARTNEDIE